MTDLILYSKPFDWNDNLSEEAIEDFETIRGKLTYCTHQSIGMALAKLELLEKQGCKVIEQQSEWQHDHEILKAYSDGASAVLDKVRAEIMNLQTYKMFEGEDAVYVERENVLQIIDEFTAEGSEA